MKIDLNRRQVAGGIAALITPGMLLAQGIDPAARGLASRALTLANAAPVTATLSGAIAHWDMSTLTYQDGAVVKGVLDASGNGSTLYQSAGAPTKQTSGGKAVLQCASGDALTASLAGFWGGSGSYGPPITAMIVFKVGSNSAINPSLLRSAGTTPLNIQLSNDPSSDTLGLLWAGGNSLATVFAGPDLNDGKWHVGIVTVDTTGSVVWVDGYIVAATTGNLLAAANLSAPIIGGMVGQYGQIALWSRKLTASEIAGLSASMTTKWTAGGTARRVAYGAQTYLSGSTADGSTYRIWSPSSPDPSGVLVIWCHPQGQNEQISPTYFAWPLAMACMSMGYWFAASSMGYSGSPGGSASSWGNATAQTAISQLKAVVDGLQTINKVVLVGASMGACAATLAVIKGTLPNVKGVYCIDGALSLFSMYKTSGYYATIDAGYGMTTGTLSSAASAGATSISSSISYSAGTIIAVETGTSNCELVTVAPAGPTGSGPYTIPLTTGLVNAHGSGVRVSDYGSKTAGNDPMTASTSAFSGLRLRLTASAADTVVAKAANTDAFAARISGVATESAVVAHKGAHLVGGASNPADLIEFVARCVA